MKNVLRLFRCVFILITVSGDRQLQAGCRAIDLVLHFAINAPPLLYLKLVSSRCPGVFCDRKVY